MTEQLDPEFEQVRDVYAHYGLAMYHAQCLESGVWNLSLKYLLLCVRRSSATPKDPRVREMVARLRSHAKLQQATGEDRRDAVRDVFDEALDLFSRKSFGGLLHSLEHDFGDPDTASRLVEARDKRNWLAHRYFWDRAGELSTEHGRALMVQELRETVSYFDELNKWLDSLTIDWLRQHGLTDQMLERYMREIIDEAQGPA